MLRYPKTLEEAIQYRYGTWAGNPQGHPYKENRCAYEVWSQWVAHQCQRKNGYGPEGLYCKQHAKILAQ